MTNYEKYKDEIISFLKDKIGVNPARGSIFKCEDYVCEDECCHCLFIKSVKPCNQCVAEWLNAEVKEKKEFTDDERDYARIIDKVKFYARDKGGFLYGYVEKPVKWIDTWRSYVGYYMLVNASTSLSFSAIQWEDDEPTSRDEILNS